MSEAAEAETHHDKGLAFWVRINVFAALMLAVPATVLLASVGSSGLPWDGMFTTTTQSFEDVVGPASIIIGLVAAAAFFAFDRSQRGIRGVLIVLIAASFALAGADWLGAFGLSAALV